MTLTAHGLRHLSNESHLRGVNVPSPPPSFLGYLAAFIGKYSTFPGIIPHKSRKHLRWQIKYASGLYAKKGDENGRTFWRRKASLMTAKHTSENAWLSINHNPESFWTFYDNPGLELPNTNNAMGGPNSAIKEKLGRHRGFRRNE